MSDVATVKELLKGVAIVIDDKIKNPDKNLRDILSQLEAASIPIIQCEKLPESEEMDHFHSISFVFLDWKLLPLGVKDGEESSTAIEDREKDNIKFIKNLMKKCFCPIFIFSDEALEDIQHELEKGSVIKPVFKIEDITENIFLKSKGDLQGNDKLFEEVASWIKKTPSIYVLLKWNQRLQEARAGLFYGFQKESPIWPTLMWKCFKEDKVNARYELGALLFQNMFTRMSPIDFDEQVLKGTSKDTGDEQDETPVNVIGGQDKTLMKVIEGTKFIDKEILDKDFIGTGDIFCPKNEKDDSATKYFLNITPQCDLLRGRRDNIKLCCLEGKEIGSNGMVDMKKYEIRYGCFVERVNQAIVPFVANGLIIDFSFKEVSIRTWGDMKGDRIGRLLPPYIIQIQQRFSFYMQRQGLPRIPSEAIGNNSDDQR